MNICLMTNTYLPHVGGVARSVSTFAEEYRRLGHEVLVVAPDFPGRKLPRRQEAIVERIAALQQFNGSDFSVRLPLAAALSERLDNFRADIFHAHHPFLLGDTALRLAARRNVPVVFTHHTRYEDYTHYVPFDSPALKQAAIHLSTDFANLCDGVIAPSASIARLLQRRGVHAPIRVIPTGIAVEAFASGNGARARERLGIPRRAFVIGHVGRLATEKNLSYLAEAVAPLVAATPGSRFLVVGAGPAEDDLVARFERAGAASRLVRAGLLTGRPLHDAYRAMDVFAFSSLSETQGMVVTEAMAASVPVVALRGSGVREVVRHDQNGYLLPAGTRPAVFATHLARLRADPRLRRRFAGAARATADSLSRRHCAEQALGFYEHVRALTRRERLVTDRSPWGTLLRRVGVEWEIVARNARTVADALASAS
ncbi:MAG: glycosyltransferase [Opitutae bacterium]|nr:glycosyltransferase [Opitutae bacterium]